MQVTLRDLVVSQSALSELCGQKGSAKMTYTLALVLNAVRPHLEAYQKAVEVLQEKYFIPDEKNKEVLRVDPSKRDVFRQESDEILAQEVNLPIGKIRFTVFAAENLDINAINLSLLQWLIKEDDAETFFEATS